MTEPVSVCVSRVELACLPYWMRTTLGEFNRHSPNQRWYVVDRYVLIFHPFFGDPTEPEVWLRKSGYTREDLLRMEEAGAMLRVNP